MTGNMTGNTSRNCDTPDPRSIQIVCIKLCTVTVALSLSLCLMGCAPTATNETKVQPKVTIPATSTPQTLTPQTKPKLVSELAQYLPITAIATISGREIQLEVANTPQEQEKGLMFRPPLSDDRGMLFTFLPARPVAFWMKNTVIPLDIIFIRADGTIAKIVPNAIPYSLTPIDSDETVASVLEVAGGTAEALHIVDGDKVSWSAKGAQ